jgi:membrane fusion protein (multidrug efflux system)
VTAAWDGSAWLIDQGLKAGDRVIVDGVQKAVPGQPVRPVAYHAPTDTPATATRNASADGAPAAPLKIRSAP